MRLRCAALSLLLSLPVAGGSARAGEPEAIYTGAPITLERVDAELPELLIEIAAGHGGIDLLVGPAAHDRRVSVIARDEPWDSVFARLLKEAELATDWRGGLVSVVEPRQDADDELSRCHFIGRLHFLRASLATPELVCSLERILGPGATVDASSVPGVLMLNGPQGRMDEVEAWLRDHEAIDRAAPDNDPRREALDAYLERGEAQRSARIRQELAELAQRRERDSLRAQLLRPATPRSEDDLVPKDEEVLVQRPGHRAAEPAGDLPGSFEIIQLEAEDPLTRCEFAEGQDGPLQFRDIDARSLLEELPPASCAVEALPEALSALEETRVSAAFMSSDFEGIVSALVNVAGLEVEAPAGQPLRLVPADDSPLRR